MVLVTLGEYLVEPASVGDAAVDFQAAFGYLGGCEYGG